MAYQMMKGKKGNNDGFPSIPGMIARYSALGLTNEQMAANPVWVDKTGNGHDIQLKNFSWKGMSGVGGYEMNFDLWRNNVPSIPDISMSTTTTSVSVSVGNSTYNNNLIYIHISNWDINKNHWLKVTSTYEDGDLAFIFYNDSNTKKIGLPANGYVNILAYPEFKGSYMYISTISNKQGSFTVEQLPLYPGALVFDGVDDYGTCENFPIMTKEKGYTVVALRQWIEEKNSITALVSNSKNWNQDGAFVFEYNNLENNYPNLEISFGSSTKLGREKSSFTYQTSKLYNGKEIKFGEFLGSDRLTVAKANENLSRNSNVAIWELVFLDHDATEEELTKIKDYFVKTYPWLFPDQAWTITGKTNEDKDRATIANITGNDNDLVLSNFGFIEGSGYNEEGEYAGYLVTDGVDDQIRSSAITMGKDFTVVTESILIQPTENNVTDIVKPNSFSLYNYIAGVNTYINRTGTGYLVRGTRTIKAFSSDGRLYSEDWSEHIDNTEQTVSSSTRGLTVGYSAYGVTYTKLAFKNLAIYPTVLSKEDCIKAYNYLQTLKAK
jgi:hypothetical protein